MIVYEYNLTKLNAPGIFNLVLNKLVTTGGVTEHTIFKRKMVTVLVLN